MVSLRFALLALVVTAACSPAPPTAPPAPAAPPEARLLTGGMRLLLLELPGLDRIEGTLRFHAGSIHEPEHQVGLLEVLVDALFYGGPMQRSGAEHNARMTERGAGLAIQQGPEVFELDFWCTPGDLEATLADLLVLLETPAYPEEFVARARERLIDRLEREGEDPSAVADRLTADQAFGPTAPHVRRPTFATAEAITRDAVLAWHRAHLGPDRAWIGLAGPVQADGAAALIERAFAALPPVGPAPAVASRPCRTPDETRIALAILPGSERVESRFVAPGPGMDDPDFAALRLWSDAVGADGDGNGAFFAPRWSGGGDLFGFASGDAFDLGLLESLDPEAFPAPRLEAARERLLAAEAEAAASPRARLERLLDLAFHGRPANFWERHLEELRALDAAEVERAAARHLPRTGVVLVSVHPAPPETLPLDSYPVDPRPDLRGTPEGIALAAALLEAAGGRDAWSWVGTLLVEGQVDLGDDAPVQARIWRDLVGERLRLEQTRDGVTTAQVVTADGSWSLDGETVQRLSFEIFDSAHHREERLLFRVLRDLARGRTFARAGRGGALEVLRAGAPLCRLELGDDGLPLRSIVPGGPGERDLVTTFADWRRVETRGGAELAVPAEMHQPLLKRSFRWERIEVDAEQDPDLFRVE